MPMVTSRARTTAAAVGGLHAGRPHRVELGEAGVQVGRLGTPLVHFGLQRGRDVGVAARDAEIVDDDRGGTAPCPRRAGHGAPAA